MCFLNLCQQDEKNNFLAFLLSEISTHQLIIAVHPLVLNRDTLRNLQSNLGDNKQIFMQLNYHIKRI